MRVVLTPVPVGYGTTFRCLAIAAECRRRGHEVMFACHPDRHDLIQQHEFPVQAIHDATPDPESPTPAVQQYLSQHSRDLLAAQLKDILGIIREFRADVAVTSHNAVTMIAAAVADIPSVSVFHPDAIGAHSPRLLFLLLREWLHLALLGRRSRPRRHVPPAPFGDLSCIPSIPELIHWPRLQPPHVLLHKAEAVPVGALLMTDPDTLPERAVLRRDLDIPAATPFVFATVGGAIARVAYVRTLVAGLMQADVQAIISVGHRLPDDEMQRLNQPPVRVVRYLADDLPAVQAADAVLWHGGHETMLKAVACATPAVGVPFQFDQDSNVRALAHTGAGIRIGKRELRAERLADALTRVIREPAYREAAARLADANRRAGGAPRLVDLLEQQAAAR